jgi:hypothetical protein
MKKTLIIVAMIAVSFMVPLFSTSYTYAAADDSCNSGGFLGFPSWYRGLTNDDCTIKESSDVGGVKNFILMIAGNILAILMTAASYVCVGFLLYGGFLYLTSQGSVDVAKRANKTILNAVIGLVIAIIGVSVINFIYARILV